MQLAAFSGLQLAVTGGNELEWAILCFQGYSGWRRAATRRDKTSDPASPGLHLAATSSSGRSCISRGTVGVDGRRRGGDERQRAQIDDPEFPGLQVGDEWRGTQMGDPETAGLQLAAASRDQLERAILSSRSYNWRRPPARTKELKRTILYFPDFQLALTSSSGRC